MRRFQMIAAPGFCLALVPALAFAQRASVVDRVPGLTPGVYTVGINFQGFKTIRREKRRLRISQEAVMDWHLELATVEGKPTRAYPTRHLELAAKLTF